MKLQLTTAKRLEVYYDGHCGMCCSFVEWLVTRERAFKVECLPYQQDEAKEKCPQLLELKPDKEIIVRVDGQDIYKGAEGWVWCLWSCVQYQEVAKLMNCRALLPIAKKACYLVSKNRLRLSKLIFGKKAREVAEEIHRIEIQESCDDGECNI